MKRQEGGTIEGLGKYERDAFQLKNIALPEVSINFNSQKQ